MTEAQALRERLNTLAYLNNLGVDEIALSCAFVPPGTNLETQFNAGQFRPPWLWSIIEIIKAAKENSWPLSVGGFEDTPPPVATPNNCPSCDEHILQQIENHRLTNNTQQISSLTCQCKEQWQTQVDNSEVSIKTHNKVDYELIQTS